MGTIDEKELDAMVNGSVLFARPYGTFVVDTQKMQTLIRDQLSAEGCYSVPATRRLLFLSNDGEPESVKIDCIDRVRVDTGAVHVLDDQGMAIQLSGSARIISYSHTNK